MVISVGRYLRTQGKSEKRAFCSKDARCSSSSSVVVAVSSLLEASTHKSIMTHAGNVFCASWLWPLTFWFPKINRLQKLITHVDIAAGVGRALSRLCLSVCLFVRALTGKRLEQIWYRVSFASLIKRYDFSTIGWRVFITWRIKIHCFLLIWGSALLRGMWTGFDQRENQQKNDYNKKFDRKSNR